MTCGLEDLRYPAFATWPLPELVKALGGQSARRHGRCRSEIVRRTSQCDARTEEEGFAVTR